MARFYARFDQIYMTQSGQLGDTGDVDLYFDHRTIGNDSASSALLRDGLIASRSALSTDAYQDIPVAYQGGDLGTIIPADLVTINQSSGFVSWSAGYTASAAAPAGIRVPTTYPYYRTRPTASVLSTDSRISSQFGAGGVSYNRFLSASNAVTTVLNSFSSGDSPLTVLLQGNDRARTLHSVWHDDFLLYFAYDNFTPGTPQSINARHTYAAVNGNNPSASVGQVYFSMSREYLNDHNSNASCSLIATLRYATSSNGSFTGKDNLAASLTLNVPVSYWTASDTVGMKTWRWNPGTIIKANGNLIDGQSSDGLQLAYSITFYDPVITSSAGPTASDSKTTGATATVNGTNLGGNTCFIKLGAT